MFDKSKEKDSFKAWEREMNIFLKRGQQEKWAWQLKAANNIPDCQLKRVGGADASELLL